MEFDSIYNNRNKIKLLLEKIGIKYTELKPKTPFLYDMFVRPVKYRSPEGKYYPFHYGYEWCGARGIRWGTTCKTAMINNHYEGAYGIKHSNCYTEYGLKRTGCAGCPYGRDFEHELEVIQKYEPKLYKAINNIFGESYEYTRKYREFCKKKNEK